MRIGVPRELKPDENRVGMTPAGVQTLVRLGHQVWVEQGAGEGSGFSDQDYRDQGATVMADAAAVWGEAELVVKVKEPQPSEYRYFRPDLLLFTYLHLAPEPQLTAALKESGMAALGYETVEAADGSLPLLIPMSEIAGRMAAQVGAQFLERPYGGQGILLGGVPGVPAARVAIIGGGTVGSNAARIAVGLGALVTVVDKRPDRLRALDDLYQGRVQTLMSNEVHIAEAVTAADLVVSSVLVPGARAPHLVRAEMVAAMRPGSVVVDVAIDQGGSVETVDHSTTHSHPTFVRYGVVHYAVANMPGAVPRTATLALTNATLPYVTALAEHGLAGALGRDAGFLRGLNVYRHHVTHRAVAEALGQPYSDPAALLR